MSRTTNEGLRWTLPFALALSAVMSMAACENRVGSPPCDGPGDCAAGEMCLDGACEPNGVSCAIDSDCGADSFCNDGRCVSTLDPNPGEGEGEGEPTGSGTVKVTPSGEIDFGSPILGVGVDKVISVMNFGGGVFDVTGLSLGAGVTDEFSWSSETPLPVTLEPGDRVELTLTYTLADGEDDAGVMYLHTTAAGCEPACADPTAIEVPLLSEFKGARNLLVTPELHDFGFIQPVQSSPPRSVLITNEGTIDKVLTVSAIDITGDTDQFDWEELELPLLLAPGESAEMPVVYMPTIAATGHQLTVTVSANSDSPDRQTDSARLVGTSQPPNALVFDPPQLVFPQLAVGQSAQQQSVLRNVGGEPIAVTALVVGNQIPVEYTVQTAQTLPYTLLPGAEMDVYVDFTSATGALSNNQVQALNNQSSGDVPVLELRGDGYVPPGGPNLTVQSGPGNEPLEGCLCQATGNVPAANVDLSYRATAGAVCSKPQNPACGINGGECACDAMDAYGDVSWGAGREEEVRGETWIVDEKIEHTGEGQDGTFTVRADLLDDCLAVPGSTSVAVNHGCCLLDCDNGGAQACYPYDPFPYCAASCDYFANTATSQDCLMRGPVPVKTSVRIWGGGYDETRYFCRTLQQSGDSTDVVTLQRSGGYFQITAVSPGVTEVAAGQACPE